VEHPQENPWLYGQGTLMLLIACTLILSLPHWSLALSKRAADLREELLQQDPRYWPLRAQPPRTPDWELPLLPYSDQWKSSTDDVLQPLVAAIAWHPSEGVHEDLLQKITDGAIEPLLHSDDDFNLFFVESEADSERLELIISEPYLLTIKTEEDLLWLMLQLEHEYAHYSAWKRGESLMPTIPAQGTLDDQQYQQALDSACSEFFTSESQAYTAECRLGLSWGMDPLVGVCGYVDSPYWHHALFLNFAGSHSGKDSACLYAWATQAGHPRPEAFRQNLY